MSRIWYNVVRAICAAAALATIFGTVNPAFAQDTRDGRLVKVRIGGHELSIPGNYFLRGRPREAEADSLLIDALMPNMDPMRNDNKDEFLYARGYGNSVGILIDDARRTTTVQYRLKVEKEDGAPYDRAPDIYGLKAYVPRDFGIVRPTRFRDEIYVQGDETNPEGFITCSVDGSVPSPICSYHFSYENLLLSVSFNKKHLPRWRAIDYSVRALLERFAEHA